MARSDQNQHLNRVVQNDYGIVTLGADGTVVVKTPLSQVHSGVAVHRSGNVMATTLRVSALSGESVTITDAAGANNADAIVAYHLMGV